MQAHEARWLTDEEIFLKAQSQSKKIVVPKALKALRNQLIHHFLILVPKAIVNLPQLILKLQKYLDGLKNSKTDDYDFVSLLLFGSQSIRTFFHLKSINEASSLLPKLTFEASKKKVNYNAIIKHVNSTRKYQKCITMFCEASFCVKQTFDCEHVRYLMRNA